MEMLSDMIRSLQQILEKEGDMPVMTENLEGSSSWGWSGYCVEISKGYDVWHTNADGVKELRRTTSAGAVDPDTNKYVYLPEDSKFLVTY